MKKLCLALLGILMAMPALLGQQDTHYTGYMFNSLVINPAYAGNRGVTSATAYYRHQWANIPSAPRDFSASIHGTFQKNNGVGLFIENDKLGVHNRLRAFASYAYKLRFGDKAVLSLGLQAGILAYNSKFSDVDNLQDPSDPIYSVNRSRVLPNFGLGLFFSTPKGYIGLSIPHLLNNKIHDFANDTPGIDVASREERHYFLSGGTVITINESTGFRLRPTFMLKMAPLEQAPVSIDFSLAFIFSDTWLVGAAYRLTDSFSGFAQYTVNRNVAIGYAYDYPLHNLGTIAGSHEVFVNFEFGFEDERIVTPRFF